MGGSKRHAATQARDYSTLPAGVRLEETIESVEAKPVPGQVALSSLDPHGVPRDH